LLINSVERDQVLKIGTRISRDNFSSNRKVNKNQLPRSKEEKWKDWIVTGSEISLKTFNIRPRSHVYYSLTATSHLFSPLPFIFLQNNDKHFEQKKYSRSCMTYNFLACSLITSPLSPFFPLSRSKRIA